MKCVGIDGAPSDKIPPSPNSGTPKRPKKATPSHSESLSTPLPLPVPPLLVSPVHIAASMQLIPSLSAFSVPLGLKESWAEHWAAEVCRSLPKTQANYQRIFGITTFYPVWHLFESRDGGLKHLLFLEYVQSSICWSVKCQKTHLDDDMFGFLEDMNQDENGKMIAIDSW